MIPGSNLLNMAFSVIGKQTVSYLRATGETVNAIGYKVPTFATAVSIQGSFQPVPRRLYQVYGLDMEKNYATFYTSLNVQDIQRAKQGDVVEFNNVRWLCQSENDWFAVDGWTGVLLVDIGPAGVTP